MSEQRSTFTRWGVQQAIQEVFPDQEADAVVARMKETGGARDMVAVENWTIVQAMAN
jgi:hypothetical protein